MARELSVDTQRQNFLIEAINQETFSRVQWHLKYYDKTTKLNKLRDPSPNEKREIRIKKLYKGVPKFPEGKVLPEIIYPPKGKSKKDELEADAKFRAEMNVLPEMLPVISDTKDLLYDGFTKEEKGRYQYLKKRHKSNPEDKFIYPLLSSWSYGWKLKDTSKDCRSPTHGRSRIVRDTFYRPNGIFYEPLALTHSSH